MRRNARVTRKISLTHFWGQFGGKHNQIVLILKLLGWMSYPNSQIMEMCCFGKKNFLISFCLLHLHIGIIKVNIISKFAIASNNVMYVHAILYLDCIKNVQQSETKKVNIKSNKRKSTLIVMMLIGLHLYMCFAWKVKIVIDIVYSTIGIGLKIRKCSNL